MPPDREPSFRSRWRLPDPSAAPPGQDLLAIGADLEPDTMLAAYSCGVFPMPVSDAAGAPIGWLSPDPRAIFLRGHVHCSRSLRRVLGRFDVTVDEEFDEVLAACADPHRPLRWIDRRMSRAYIDLHDAGWAHSVEVRDRATGRLAGGLFGVEIGGLFAAESMFHRFPNASKVALVQLGQMVASGSSSEHRIIDAQWMTPHLATMGAVEVPRIEYLGLLDEALSLDPAVGRRRMAP